MASNNENGIGHLTGIGPFVNDDDDEINNNIIIFKIIIF